VGIVRDGALRHTRQLVDSWHARHILLPPHRPRVPLLPASRRVAQSRRGEKVAGRPDEGPRSHLTIVNARLMGEVEQSQFWEAMRGFHPAGSSLPSNASCCITRAHRSDVPADSSPRSDRIFNRFLSHPVVTPPKLVLLKTSRMRYCSALVRQYSPEGENSHERTCRETESRSNTGNSDSVL
jgi:hypothetical protein